MKAGDILQVLIYLTDHLHRVAANAKRNKMDYSNLATCWCLTLMKVDASNTHKLIRFCTVRYSHVSIVNNALAGASRALARIAAAERRCAAMRKRVDLPSSSSLQCFAQHITHFRVTFSRHA